MARLPLHETRVSPSARFHHRRILPLASFWFKITLQWFLIFTVNTQVGAFLADWTSISPTKSLGPSIAR
ncbi:hypothetical protein PIB30_115189, partial [Stylosanthes scabra]|nr:hypothetical protein [Stylosanthes scabra]